MHICLPPRVAVYTPNKELFWHPNLLFFLLPHLLPAENPQIATQYFKQAPTPSEKASVGPARGFPTWKKRGGGPIVVRNTSWSAEGTRVWACSAAYVDPAVSFGDWFSSGAGCTSIIPLTQQHSQKLFKNGIHKEWWNNPRWSSDFLISDLLVNLQTRVAAALTGCYTQL